MMPARALPGTDTALPCTCSIGTDQENKGTSSGNKISISTPCCRGVCNVKHLKKLFSMSAITAVTNCAGANCSEGCYAHWPPPPPLPGPWLQQNSLQSSVNYQSFGRFSPKLSSGQVWCCVMHYVMQCSFGEVAHSVHYNYMRQRWEQDKTSPASQAKERQGTTPLQDQSDWLAEPSDHLAVIVPALSLPSCQDALSAGQQPQRQPVMTPGHSAECDRA